MAARCKSCRASITWVTMAGSGVPMPIDPKPTTDGTIVIVGGLGVTITKDMTVAAEKRRYTPHWVTCPSAAQHRKHAFRGLSEGSQECVIWQGDDRCGRTPDDQIHGVLL